MLAHVLKGHRSSTSLTSISSPLLLTKTLSSPSSSSSSSSSSASSSSSSSLLPSVSRVSSTPSKPSSTSSQGLTEILEDPTQKLQKEKLNELKKNSKKQKNKQQQSTKDKWYSLKTPELTPEVKRDLQVLNMRHLIYKDQHFKKPDRKKGKLPEKFELGEVVGSAADFYSGRLTKAEKSQTFLEEVFKDQKMQQFAKKKWKELQIDPSRSRSKETNSKRKLKEKLAVKKKIDRRKAKTKPGEQKKINKKKKGGGGSSDFY